MLVGYARVSSVGQSLEVQLSKLSNCSKVFQERVSAHGFHSAARPELKYCLDFVREGDSLVITKLDRLARSTYHLCQIVEALEKKKVSLIVLDQNIDTTTPTGRLLFNMLGAIAQFETEIRHERQCEGIAKAKSHGVVFGRKFKLTKVQQQELVTKRSQGIVMSKLCKEYKISIAAAYRYLSNPNYLPESA